MTIAAPAWAQDEPWSPEQTRAFLTTSGVCFAVGLPLTTWNNEQDNAYDDVALESMSTSTQLSELTTSQSGLDDEDRARMRSALERPTLTLHDVTLGAGVALNDLLAAARVPPASRRAWRLRLRGERDALAAALGVVDADARVDAVYAILVGLSGT